MKFKNLIKKSKIFKTDKNISMKKFNNYIEKSIKLKEKIKIKIKIILSDN
jgi:hypothetical protein